MIAFSTLLHSHSLTYAGHTEMFIETLTDTGIWIIHKIQATNFKSTTASSQTLNWHIGSTSSWGEEVILWKQFLWKAYPGCKETWETCTHQDMLGHILMCACLSLWIWMQAVSQLWTNPVGHTAVCLSGQTIPMLSTLSLFVVGVLVSLLLSCLLQACRKMDCCFIQPQRNSHHS